MQASENSLATGSIGKLMVRFAVPSVTAMLVNALYNIVDQIFIGRGVGYLGNGAANVVLLMTLAALALAMWLGDGAAALVSISLGQGQTRRAAEGAGTALTLTAAVSVGATAAALLFLEPILRLLGCTDALLPYARPYGLLTALGLPMMMTSTAINALLRADGRPRCAMVAMVAGALVNGGLDPILIFGLGWGIRGAAAATLAGQGVSFVLSAWYLAHPHSLRLDGRCFCVRAGLAGRILALGASSLVDQLSFTLVMAVNNNLIVHYGALSAYGSEIPLTAYGVSMKVQEILFTVVLGIALGMQPIVGYNHGAGRPRRVRQAYGLAVGVGTAVCALAVVLFVGCPGVIIRLFGAQSNALYYDFCQRFFRTYFLLYLTFGFITITGVFFQAVGKPAQAAFLSLCYQLAFKIFSAVLLSRCLGLDGVLWSGPVADALATLLAGTLVAAYLLRRRAEGNPAGG